MTSSDTSSHLPPSNIEAVVVPRTTDLGDGFTVQRALPSVQRRMVGPFVFFDQMGPSLLHAGHGLDVRPHPHIGLATVTYLFDGEIMHRDSLATVQSIRPGELNWMTAGRGIVHSERTPQALRAHDHRVFGIQAWVALSKQHEEIDPSFVHHAESELPSFSDTGFQGCLIAGHLSGLQSPAQTLSAMFYADVLMNADGRFHVPAEHHERAMYVVEGSVVVESSNPNNAAFNSQQLLVFAPGKEIVVQAQNGPARVMLFGGEPMDGPRYLWWNFVSSSKERIEQAQLDWKEQRFAAVPDETEFIPAPDLLAKPVNYP